MSGLVATALAVVITVTAFLSSGRAAVQCPRLESTPLSSAPTLSECVDSALTVLDAPDDGGQTKIIYLAGLFPVSQNSEVDNAHYLLPAVSLALDSINCDPNILPGYHLKIDVLDTACDAARGTYELVNSIGYPGPSSVDARLAVLGPGCSAVSRELAGFALQAPYLPLVSYSPALVRQSNITGFFKMVSTINQATEAALSVLDYFNWTSNIALAYEEDSLYTSTIEEFAVPPADNTEDEEEGRYMLKSKTYGYKANLAVFKQFTTHDSIKFGASTVDQFIQDVRENNVRVIVTLLSPELVYQLFCEASNGTVPVDGFVWVMIGNLGDSWWQGFNSIPNCNLTAKDVESVINIPGQVISSKENTFLEYPNKTFGEVRGEYEKRLQTWCPNAAPHKYFPITYDATWSLALAIHSSIDALDSYTNQSDFQFKDTGVNRGLVRELMDTDFIGASGTVQFNSNGERTGSIAIFQFQGVQGEARVVAVFNSEGIDFHRSEADIVWPGNRTDIPSDTHFREIKSVPPWLIGMAIVITVGGLIFSTLMFVFNFVYRKHRILIAGSQKLNYIIILGMWFGYVSVLLLALLESDVGKNMKDMVFKFFCLLRLWLLMFSFTLSYGIMFARAWRIYRIFNDPFVSKRKFLKDFHLILIDGALLVGDCLILIPWTIWDPYRRYEDQSEVDFEQFTQCTFFACSSDNVILWFGILFVYKVLIMIGGVFVVSLVRKGVIERKIYDDSRSLSVALYLAALCFVLGFTLQILFQLQFKIVFAFAINMIWVNTVANVTIGCVFLPKFYYIVIKKRTGRTLHTAKSVFLAQNPKAAVTDAIDGSGNASVYHIYSREDLFTECSTDGL